MLNDAGYAKHDAVKNASGFENNDKSFSEIRKAQLEY